MELSPELTTALEAFRRAAKNGQPLMALEYLVPVIDALVGEPVREEPMAKLAPSRKTTKAAAATQAEDRDGDESS